MRILAIETSTEACSLALFDGDVLLARRHEILGRGHAERLVPLIAELPDRGRVDEIRVSLGPGSFTGVRIGLAAGRALGLAWGARVRGFPSLALVALTAQDIRSEPVSVCMNGGHGEWFVQDFSASGEAETAAVSLPPQSAIGAARHPLIAGTRAADFAELAGDGRTALTILPNAAFACRLAPVTLMESLSPIYGRAPDAKMPG